jgi:aminoacylase
MDSDIDERSEVKLFREYLRIKSVQPNPDYVSCVSFLQKIAASYNLEFTCLELVKGKPIVVISCCGTEPSLPSILLNSHIDVVPVIQDQWSFDPWSAHKDAEGNIFGRGAQDMKCVTIQYLEALRRLKSTGTKLRRTVHVSCVPDEEIGGHDGMAIWVQSSHFKSLNIGFALDEGLASPNEKFSVFYGERAPWWFYLKSKGPTGHGSRLFEHTAVDKLLKCLKHFMQLRDDEFNKLKTNKHLTLGDVITVNITMLKSGVWGDDYCSKFQTNIIPPDAEAAIDCRIPPTVNLEEFEKQTNEWCKDVHRTFLQKTMCHCVTSITDDNKWWSAFKEACSNLGMEIELQIFPAATDIRYVRAMGVPALGFSPMNNTPILLHEHNEYLNEKVFLKGIDIYCHLIKTLANLS